MHYLKYADLVLDSQDLTETETTKAKDQHAVKEIIEHETTIKVPAGGTRIDKSDTVEDMEILFSSPGVTIKF